MNNLTYTVLVFSSRTVKFKNLIVAFYIWVRKNWFLEISTLSYWNKQWKGQHSCIRLDAAFWPSWFCCPFLPSDECISKLPISCLSVALGLCSPGDISNTKIAPCQLQWPAPYSSIYHIKMHCSATVTFHSSISVSLFRFPADWQCQLQHFTQFFFSMCEIT